LCSSRTQFNSVCYYYYPRQSSRVLKKRPGNSFTKTEFSPLHDDRQTLKQFSHFRNGCQTSIYLLLCCIECMRCWPVCLSRAVYAACRVRGIIRWSLRQMPLASCYVNLSFLAQLHGYSLSELIINHLGFKPHYPFVVGYYGTWTFHLPLTPESHFCRPTQCGGATFAMVMWLSVCLSRWYIVPKQLSRSSCDLRQIVAQPF